MRRVGISVTTRKPRQITFWLSCMLPLWVIPALSLSAGRYEISWYTIDGGGGQSAAGPYALSGTIGQPDVAWNQGGRYEVLGGFWPGVPLPIVDFDDFAQLAEQWLQTGSHLAGDLDGDKDVDFQDLRRFGEYWLCYYPKGWQLK